MAICNQAKLRRGVLIVGRTKCLYFQRPCSWKKFADTLVLFCDAFPLVACCARMCRTILFLYYSYRCKRYTFVVVSIFILLFSFWPLCSGFFPIVSLSAIDEFPESVAPTTCTSKLERDRRLKVPRCSRSFSRCVPKVDNNRLLIRCGFLTKRCCRHRSFTTWKSWTSENKKQSEPRAFVSAVCTRHRVRAPMSPGHCLCVLGCSKNILVAYEAIHDREHKIC